MSISDKLQSMMNNNESGTFLTKEKKRELKNLNEGLFSSLGADIADVSRVLLKKMKTITSKTGIAIKNIIAKIDIEHFKKEMGIKNIQDLDAKLSLMEVNNPEFFGLMRELMVANTKAKKTNKELYDALSPIFDKHMDRMADYYETLLKTSKDNQQGAMYITLLTDMIGWLDKDRNANLRSSILSALADYIDRKSLRKTLKQANVTKASEDKNMQDIDKIEKKFGKEITQFNADDIKKLSIDEREAFIQAANKYLEDYEKGNWANKINPTTGTTEADFDAVGANMNVADALATAIRLRGTKPTPPTAPRPAPTKAPAGAPPKPAVTAPAKTPVKAPAGAPPKPAATLK